MLMIVFKVFLAVPFCLSNHLLPISFLPPSHCSSAFCDSHPLLSRVSHSLYLSVIVPRLRHLCLTLCLCSAAKRSGKSLKHARRELASDQRASPSKEFSAICKQVSVASPAAAAVFIWTATVETVADRSGQAPPLIADYHGRRQMPICLSMFRTCCRLTVYNLSVNIWRLPLLLVL